MGQVVKYVAGYCPRVLKTIPWAGLLKLLVRLEQSIIGIFLLVTLLTFSGDGWQALEEQPLGKGLLGLNRQAAAGYRSVTAVQDTGLQLLPDSGNQNTPMISLGRIELNPLPDMHRNEVPAASPDVRDNQVHTSNLPQLQPDFEPKSVLEPGKQYLRSISGAGKCVALTFDDGPFPEWTERYLRVLDAHKARATFFMVGRQVISRPEVIKAIVASGHEVASHSWRHANLNKASEAEIEADLRQTSANIEKITGQPVKYFRPPYGALSPRLLSTADKLGLLTVNWCVDPCDWTNPGPQVIVKRVMANVGDGSIILLHEGHPGTLVALPDIINNLRESGYELVTVSELIIRASKEKEN